MVRGSLGPLGFLNALEDLDVSFGILLSQVSPEGGPVWALLTAFFAGDFKSATPQLDEFVLDTRANSWVWYEYWDDERTQEGVRQLVESRGISCLMLDGLDGGQKIGQDFSTGPVYTGAAPSRQGTGFTRLRLRFSKRRHLVQRTNRSDT